MGLFGRNKKEDLVRREREFLDVIGHELRTPLSIVKVSFDLLKEKLNKTPSQEDFSIYFERIDEAVHRAERILESTISSAKIEEGRLEMRLEKVDLIPIIRNSVFSVEKALKEKGLGLTLDLPEQLEVYADKIRTQEIMDNFVSNAVKYTENGEIQISVRTENSQAVVSIKDSGVGISPEDVRKLGSKFFRVAQEEKEDDLVKPGGTGLGLYIAFNLISLMNGSFKVESELNKGSSFTFTLPLYTNQPVKREENNEQKDLFKRMGFTQKAS